MLHNSCEGEEWEKKCEGNSPAYTKVAVKGGGGGAPSAGEKVRLQPMTKAMTKIVPLGKMKNHVRAGIHPAAHRWPHTGAGAVIFILSKQLS